MGELLSVGTKVQVMGFPVPTGQVAPFDYNGLTGVVKKVERVGFGLNNQPVYSYEVFFEGVTVPIVTRTPDGRLAKSTKKGDASGFFEESYLIRVG